MNKILERPIWAPLILVLSITILARSFLFESFWLDETITIWIVEESIKEAIWRAYHFQGQSPFYYLLIFPLYKIFGVSEFFLRLPSLIFLVISCWILYKIALKSFNKEIASFLALPLITLDPVLIAGLTARPYSLALMCSLLSVKFIFDWLDTNNRSAAISSILFYILTIYSHPLFAPIILLHILAILRKIDLKEKNQLKKLFAISTFILVAILPVIFQCLYLFSRKESLHFASTPNLINLISEIVPPYFALYILAGLILAAIFIGSIKFSSNNSRSAYTIQFVLVWLLSGPLLLFFISISSDKSLFVTRYFLWSMPALVIILGMLLNKIQNEKTLRAFMIAFSLFALIREGGRVWKIEDWRGAVSQIKSDFKTEPIPTLVYSGLVEGALITFHTEPLKNNYLLTPVKIYGLTKNVTSIPRSPLEVSMHDYFKNVINPILTRSKGINLICLNQILAKNDIQLVCDTLVKYVSQFKYHKTSSQTFGLVYFFKFEK